jgi:uncharacterized protein YerC
MAKYSNISKIQKEGQADLFILLVNALANITTTNAAKLLRDLLSDQEATLIARRLKIALLLDEGLTYLQIRKIIPVSDSTISKIQMWLKTYGDGFRTVLPKLKNKERAEKPESSESTWRRHKKRYAMYYWPELILKEIVKSANKREKKRLLDILSQLKEKTELTKELNAILRQNSYTT